MFYVYILQSELNEDLYVGFSDDLRTRVKTHNDGRVQSTKAYRPWKLLYYEAYRSEKDARRRELQLKMHKAKEDLKQQIQDSLTYGF